MADNKRWQDESRSQETSKSQTKEDLDKLRDVSGATYEELYMWLAHAQKLISYFRLAGYTSNEIISLFNLNHNRFHKKEAVLYKAIKNGVVNEGDSFQKIKDKLDKEYNISRQSWFNAYNNLYEQGLVK